MIDINSLYLRKKSIYGDRLNIKESILNPGSWVNVMTISIKCKMFECQQDIFQSPLDKRVIIRMGGDTTHYS